MSELHPQRQYSVAAVPLSAEERQAVAEYVADELAAIPDPTSRAIREDMALRAALVAVAWRREVEAQCAVTRAALADNARLSARIAELKAENIRLAEELEAAVRAGLRAATFQLPSLTTYGRRRLEEMMEVEP